MLKSSRNSALRIERLSCFEHSPQYVHAPSGQSDKRLGVVFSLSPFTVIERPANGIASGDSTKGALEEDTLEVFVTAKGSPPRSTIVGLAHDWCQASRCRHRISRSEARKIAHRSVNVFPVLKGEDFCGKLKQLSEIRGSPEQ